MLVGPRLQPLTAVQRQAPSFRVCSPGRRTRPLCAGFVRCSASPTGIGPWSARPRLLRFVVPLATSPLKSGLPGITTPGNFRPWPFSDLRRFSPSDGSSVLFHTDTTYGIQRTRTMRCFPCGPDRSILGTVPSGITRLGHADTPKGARTVPLRCLPTMTSSCLRKLCPEQYVDVSLTKKAASNREGRRAHRHARKPSLKARRPSEQYVDVSLTKKAASNREGRRAHRHARTHKPTTSAGHHRPLQRLHMPERQHHPFEKQAAIARCHPSPAPRSAARTTFREFLTALSPGRRALFATILR